MGIWNGMTAAYFIDIYVSPSHPSLYESPLPMVIEILEYLLSKQIW